MTTTRLASTAAATPALARATDPRPRARAATRRWRVCCTLASLWALAAVPAAAGPAKAGKAPPKASKAASGSGHVGSPGADVRDCAGCHRKVTAAAVQQYDASAHAGADVGCAACHGQDHDRMKAGKAPVPAEVCGKCHPKAYKSHSESRHNLGLHSGWGCTRNLRRRPPEGECAFCHIEGSTRPKTTLQCARFLRQSDEMRTLGCNRCHQVERACGSCHSSHMTDLSIVRDPKVCARCHMGPDHPQWEMWETSQHGQIWGKLGDKRGPTCQTCHMPAGTHNVSLGLTANAALQVYPAARAAAGRTQMLAVCGQCHARRMVAQDLDRSDKIRDQSQALVARAEEVIRDIADRGLLDPPLDKRPPHPLSGHNLVLDGQMLYEDISHIERLFFKMKKYDLAKTVKGAYHNNPAWTHWYGNAELKMDLVDILAEASRLKARAAAPARPLPPKQAREQALEGKLKVLKAQLARKRIDSQTYKREVTRLLDAFERERAATPAP